MTVNINASLTQGLVLTSDTSGVVAFQSNNAETMRIDTSGNLGIGTSSPGSAGGGGSPRTLEVYNATGTVPWGQLVLSTGVAGTTNDIIAGIEFANRGVSGAAKRGAAIYAFKSSTSSVNADTYLTFSVNNGGTFYEAARIPSTGELLVGTTTTWVGDQNSVDGISITGYGAAAFARSNNGVANFNRRGTDGSLLYMQKNGSTVGSISVTGSATAYNTSSDYRLKENVQPMTTGLATIGALKPVTYDWISDKLAGEGFIAHELQAVVPAAVTGEKDAVDSDGKPIYQGVDYSKIVVHLVAAIQEQQSIISDLQSRIAALEAK